MSQKHCAGIGFLTCQQPPWFVFASAHSFRAGSTCCLAISSMSPTACCFGASAHCNHNALAVDATCVLQICSKANHYGGSLDPHAGTTVNLAGLQLSAAEVCRISMRPA
jgi:hypothetical protein